MIDLTSISPLAFMAGMAFIFLASVGANALIFALVIGWWTSRKPGRTDPEPVVIIEQAPVPPSAEVTAYHRLQQPLPPAISIDFKGWDLGWVGERTQLMPTLATDLLDDIESEPVDLPARKRFENQVLPVVRP